MQRFPFGLPKEKLGLSAEDEYLCVMEDVVKSSIVEAGQIMVKIRISDFTLGIIEVYI